MKSESLLVFIHKFQNTYIQLSNQYITDYIYKMILVIINVLFNENTANEQSGPLSSRFEKEATSHSNVPLPGD